MRIQVTISLALFVITLAAVFCAVARWEKAIPYWMIVPCVLLLSAFATTHGGSTDLTWGLISMAWLVTFVAVINSLIKSFHILGGPPPPHEMQARFWHAYGSAVGPMVLTVPVSYLAISKPHSPSRARKWIIGVAVIAFADCTLATVSLVMLVDHGWPWMYFH